MMAGAENRDLWIRAAVRLPAAGLFAGIPLFWGAGTFQWERGWIFLCLFLGTLVANMLVMLLKNPVLLRARWTRQKGTKSYDKVFGLVYMVGCLTFFTLAGMDAGRFDWSSIPGAFIPVGLGLHLLGMIPILWSFLANPHLETTVRIQDDRDHQVITAGPYRFVRHPLYVGIIAFFVGWTLVLGSWVASGAALFIILALVVRTALEDRTLRAELEGYEDYCKKTRYRLVPGVW